MMDRSYEVGRPELSEIDSLSAIGSWAFASSSPSEMLPYFERIGHDNIRVIREGGRAVGSLGIIWMGQWFGGVSVPMAGIAAVSVSPDRRGYGAATHLMRATLREIRERGYPLSVLYPATQPVYRGVGYEQAGSRFEIRLPAESIDLKDRELDVDPITEADGPVLKQTYDEQARRASGHLDRNDFIWSRIQRPKGDPPRAYKVSRAGQVEGYVYLSKQLRDRNEADFTVMDLVALTPEAGRRILTFYADHKSLAGDFIMYGAPCHPLYSLLREQSYNAKLLFNWMLRLVDVRAALEARGYPEGLETELHVAVIDDVFPENEGAFVFEVSGGKGHVRPGGAGSFRVDVRGLASIYSGFHPPEAVMMMGLLEATPLELRRASAMFAGPPPWMPDMF